MDIVSHGDIIIESQRIRTLKGTEQTHKDHTSDRGHVFMSHHNMVRSNRFTYRKPCKFLRQKRPSARNGKHCRNYRLGTSQKFFKSKAEVTRRAKIEAKRVHLAIKNSELEKNISKHIGRMVLTGDIVNDDSGNCAVFTEQGAAARHV